MLTIMQNALDGNTFIWSLSVIKTKPMKGMLVLRPTNFHFDLPNFFLYSTLVLFCKEIYLGILSVFNWPTNCSMKL